MDLHNYKKRFERTLQRIEESDISQENKEIMYKFKDECLCRGLSYGKLDAYLFYLKKFIGMIDMPLETATKEDIMKVIADLNQTSYAEETKVCFKIVVRKIYQMLKGFEDKEYPEEVKWIKTTIPKNHKKLPEELLTEEEIENIIRAGQNIRDKALLSTLAESGARVSEIGTMKIKHVSFERYGAKITINGKTGMRKILIINSTPYLQEWINQHPKNDNSEACLWYNPRGEFLSYARISAILKKAVKKVGIRKRVYPHLLRHSRATFFADKMSEASMKQYFGWGQDSKMCGIYIHMNDQITEKAILKLNGIEVEEDKEESKLKPITCQRCKTINQVTNKFCKVCGLILNKEEADKILKKDMERSQADKIMNKLIKDPEILELIKKKLSG